MERPGARARLVAIDLARRDINLFYNVFSNRTLWPLLHSFPAKMTIRHDAYRAYLRVNRSYAGTIAPMLAPGDLVWAHDYHLMPLGHELRRLGWQGKIGYFLHTPFPPAEIFTLLPWADELMDMLMDFDLVGVQTRRHEHNLVDTLSSELPGYVIGDRFLSDGRAIRTKAYPIGIDIGIDPDEIGRMTAQAGRTAASRFFRRLPPDQKVMLGVDRLYYTKGIVLRLLTFEHLLERYPALRGRVMMVQISAPSRSRVPEYVEERRQVDELVGRINGRFSEAGWVPIHYLYRSYSQDELVTFYNAADVCLVTSLRDGMNLVAKEFVAAQSEDDPGVVVLSRFCGAADSMRDALIINPYDIEETASAMYQALRMPRGERRRRWSALIEGVRAFTAKDWSRAFLTDLQLI